MVSTAIWPRTVSALPSPVVSMPAPPFEVFARAIRATIVANSSYVHSISVSPSLFETKISSVRFTLTKHCVASRAVAALA